LEFFVVGSSRIGLRAPRCSARITVAMEQHHKDAVCAPVISPKLLAFSRGGLDQTS
jgi:hypothetical protein